MSLNFSSKAAACEIESGKHVTSIPFAGEAITICAGRTSLWGLVGPPKATLAIRLAFANGLDYDVHRTSKGFEIAFEGGLIELEVEAPRPTLLHARATYTGRSRSILPSRPRDIYCFGPQLSPEAAKGNVHARQHGPNTGLVYASLLDFGSFLYVQDFSELQTYFEDTDTSPASTVGGEWPELGFALPVSEENPIRSGKRVTISSCYLAIEADIPRTARAKGRQFVRMHADVFDQVSHPPCEREDWPNRAKRSLRQLSTVSVLTRRDFGELYVRPYTDAEYPDSMVQLSIISALYDYGRWRGSRVPFMDRLIHGVGRFYDDDLKTLRRYLPNVGQDKNADEVDSWYLYHPLKNLGILALAGEAWAKDLFFRSVDFGIRAAHHFDYRWPVKYNVLNFETTEAKRKPDEPGQSDVGGIYATVMLQAYDLTGDLAYIKEAEAAIAGLEHHAFDLLYQGNLTSLGAAACARLYELTKKDKYIDQAAHFLANLLHNSVMWESEMKNGKHYQTFMGVTCLHDAEYMAAYECFESFGSLRDMLSYAGKSLPDDVRHMAAESSRYALSRARFFYPDTLPPEALAKEYRNGYVDRNLAIPVEDIYPTGKPAGAVGQEVYGAGLAFVFCAKAYHRLNGDSGWLFCDYPLKIVRSKRNEYQVTAQGSDRGQCDLIYIPGKEPRSIEVRGGTRLELGPHRMGGTDSVSLLLTR